MVGSIFDVRVLGTCSLCFCLRNLRWWGFRLCLAPRGCRWGPGVLGAPLRAGPVPAAQEVSHNLLEDVDDLPRQDIIFCQDFSKSRGKALVSVQFGKSLLS